METHQALRLYFERKKKSSPGFSLRSLALRLKVSPSFLSRTLNGKKPIPEDLRNRLAKALDVEPELLAESKSKRRQAGGEVTSPIGDWAMADSKSYQVLRNWYYIALMEATTMANFDGRAETLSRRLGLSLQSTEVALRELVSLGLLSAKEGNYTKTDKKLRFTSAKSMDSIRKYHDVLLEKAQQELRSSTEDADFQRRLITGITLTSTPEAIQEAKRKLAECLHSIANDLAATPGTEVYHLAAQLFPLTKP